MTDYREIIRLNSLEFSNVAIANSLCCSRNTVSEVLKLAETYSLEWSIKRYLLCHKVTHRNSKRRWLVFTRKKKSITAECGVCKASISKWRNYVAKEKEKQQWRRKSTLPSPLFSCKLNNIPTFPKNIQEMLTRKSKFQCKYFNCKIST